MNWDSIKRNRLELMPVDYEDFAQKQLCHMSGGFQSQVSVTPAPGVEGDFCNANPRFTVAAGPGALVAGAAGVTVGRFAWAYAPVDVDGGPSVVTNVGAGPVTGFVGRNQQGLITTYLADASLVIPAGFGLWLYNGGDFWVKNNGSTAAVIGQKVFATLANGQASFAAAGSIPGGGSGASASIAAETWSATLSTISGDILDTSAGVVTGSIYVGSTVSSNGAGMVVSQLSGTPLGAGTYLLSQGEQSQASATIAGTYGLLSNGTVTGAFAVGQILTGSGVVAGTAITVLATGAGGTSGTSVVTNNTVVSSTTIVGSNSIETKWAAMSGGLAGELVKISDHALG